MDDVLIAIRIRADLRELKARDSGFDKESKEA